MTGTLNRGPNVSAGSLTDGRVEVMDGPTIAYQGESVPDPRYTPMNKDSMNPGAVPAFMMSPQFIVVDAIPSATNTTMIAAAQNPTTTVGATLNLVTSVVATANNVPVFTPGVPIVIFGTNTVTTVSAIDFGFATGSTVANSSTVQVSDNSIFATGQWLVIGGAANVTNKALIAQVASVSGANGTTIFISPVAGSTINFAPIGQGNYYGNLQPQTPGASIGPVQASAFAAEPYQIAGFGKMFDPRQTIARNVVIASPTTVSGTTTFIVKGFDVYGAPMSEQIAATATPGGAGNKAFKYITSIAVATAGTSGTPANISVGAGNLVGFPLRSNKWEYLDIFFNGGFSISNTGWTTATTVVATPTTGDVRGTQNCSTIVVGAAAGTASGAGFDGVKRLTINQAIEQNSMLLATPLNNASLFGVAQA